MSFRPSGTIAIPTLVWANVDRRLTTGNAVMTKGCTYLGGRMAASHCMLSPLPRVMRFQHIGVPPVLGGPEDCRENAASQRSPNARAQPVGAIPSDWRFRRE